MNSKYIEGFIHMVSVRSSFRGISCFPTGLFTASYSPTQGISRRMYVVTYPWWYQNNICCALPSPASLVLYDPYPKRDDVFPATRLSQNRPVLWPTPSSCLLRHLIVGHSSPLCCCFLDQLFLYHSQNFTGGLVLTAAFLDWPTTLSS